MIENPFESGHIKNYLLFYSSIVVIMILFFIAATLFHDVKVHEKKVFNTTPPVQTDTVEMHTQQHTKEKQASPFKLLDPKESY